MRDVSIQRLVACCLGLIVLLLTRQAVGGPLDNLEQFKADIRQHIVFIRIYDNKDKLPSQLVSQGTGVLFKGGFVLTALHLEKTFKDTAGTSRFITASIGYNEGVGQISLNYIGEEPAHDLMLLSFASDVVSVDTDVCVRPKPMKTGDQIASFGFPFGGVLDGVMGTVSSALPTKIQTANMQVTRGQSGSPVFDQEGELVGIVRGELTADGQGADIYFIVPIGLAKNLLGLANVTAGACAPRPKDVEARIAMPTIDNKYDPNSPTFSMSLLVTNRSNETIFVNPSLRCLSGEIPGDGGFETPSIQFSSKSPARINGNESVAVKFKYEDSSPHVFDDRDEMIRFWSTDGKTPIDRLSCIYVYEQGSKTRFGTTPPEVFLMDLIPAIDVR